MRPYDPRATQVARHLPPAARDDPKCAAGRVGRASRRLKIDKASAASSLVRVAPVLKSAVRSAVGVTDWVRNATAESRESLQDLYHEARAEVNAGAHDKAAPAPTKE